MKLFVATFALVLLSIPVAQAQTGEDLFQQALRTERLSGNMEAAIALYEQIIDEHSDDRGLSAQALLHLARAYESLGRTEARRAYGRLVNEYADYPEVASEARAGYERLSDRPAGRIPGTATRLTTPKDATAWGASLSHDGSLLVAPAWGDDDSSGIVLQNLRTGTSKSFDMELGEGDKGGAEFVSLSPDGRTIAAGWYPGGRTSWGTLRTLDLESGKITELVDALSYWERRHGLTLDNANIQAHEWTADGISILAYFSSGSSEPDSTGDSWHQELVLVHRDGSPPTLIAEFAEDEEYGWQKTCITSDKRYVFAQFGLEAPYIMRFNVATGDRTVWRRSAVHGITLLGCPSNPDRVLFAHDLVGGKRIYSASADEVDGSATFHTSTPEDVAFGLASKSGDLIYWPDSEKRSLWSASVDPERFDLATALENETQGEAFGLGWSPTANLVAWWDSAKESPMLWDADARERTVLELPAGTRPVRFTPFSADGALLKLNSETAWYYYDLEKGELVDSVSQDIFERLGTRWSRGTDPTGTEYAWHNDDNCLKAIAMPFGTAEPVWCINDSPGPRYFSHSLSPDHSQILIERGHHWGEDDVDHARLEIFSITDGTYRTVLDSKELGELGGRLGWASWVGNDALLVTERRVANINDILGLSVLDLNAGERTPVLESLTDMLVARAVSVSHDRRYVTALGAPRRLAEEPREATIIHRVLEARGDQ